MPIQSSAHPCLIDSETGQTFTRQELDTVVKQWTAAIQKEIPQYFTGAEAKDKEQQAAENTGGWYTYINLEKSVAVVISCLVTEHLHAAYVLSDFDDRASIIERVRPVAAFVMLGFEDATPGDHIYRIVVDIQNSKLVKIIPPSKGTDSDYTPERAYHHDVTYITFSSGSTGRPKGIYGSKFCVDFMNKARHEIYPYYAQPDGSDRPWTIGVNIFVLWECFRPLEFGGCCVIVRQDSFIDPDKFLDVIEKYHINEILLTSSYAKLFLSHQLTKTADLKTGDRVRAPSCLRRIWQNGETVTEALREAFITYCDDPSVELINLYSISECFEVGHGNMRETGTELVTFPNIRVSIRKDNKNEVVVHTPSIRHGYHKPSTESEREAYAKDLSWYRTGDVGAIISETPTQQRFKISGRCSNFIRVKGRFVNLEQIADVVERGLGLAGRGLATIEIDADTSEIVAYVDGGFESDRLPNVRALCHFPEWMPDRFVRHAPTVRQPAASGKVAKSKRENVKREEAIQQVLLDQLGIDVRSLSKPMSLRDLGISSLSILRLRENLKTFAGIDVSVAELYRITDVRKFVSETVTPEMLHAEVQRVVAFAENSSKFQGDLSKQPAAYFVTGATGFLGGWLVDSITGRYPDARLYILSRRDESGTREILTQKRLRVPSRVRILRGDVSQPGLGLDDATLAEIKQEVRYFFHCAAHVVFGCGYAEAKPSTVDGAANVLSLFLGSHPSAELHYISTNGIYPPNFTRSTNRACLESQLDFDLYAARLKEGYGWSKWVAEKSVVEVCRRHQQKLFVYRPGNIGWSHDGRVNPTDFQTLIVYASRAIHCVPDVTSWNFEITPVDTLTSFILDKCNASSGPEIYNVIGKRTALNFYFDSDIPRRPLRCC
eukprot:TRINITY_DN4247_c0_g1_i2.p1 TRINITY_DN4247_c0_g1~~TRINITY_DN4247_c0_g1_i2.p1  ORF type:complete len:890 (-),score=147.88 TRINITY_DN4247_c0_g1_i2:299-2968(-)